MNFHYHCFEAFFYAYRDLYGFQNETLTYVHIFFQERFSRCNHNGIYQKYFISGNQLINSVNINKMSVDYYYN